VKLSSKLLKTKAREIGFEKVGIVRAEILVDERTKLLQWLDREFQGEMHWMAREPGKRTDPRAIFPEAKSIVVVAHNYFTPHKHEEDPERGKISRYAWGDDYHDILKEKLRALLSYAESFDESIEGKICVDTSPMMDKAWAARAGLGWIGKHTNLITQEFGSWVFIGELILNVALEYDRDSVGDHCGTCRACLDACPTGAIVEEYLVDSNLCLSYATIELRAPNLPPEIEKNLDGWIYGCDICQDVCPWNRFEKPAMEKRFEPREGEHSLNLELIAEISPEDYQKRFRKSAVKRAKFNGLKRNARALRNFFSEKNE
jgi:epoxyqueuosine reductase